MSAMHSVERSVVHGSFTVRRRYPQPPATVFAFWADPGRKKAWFASPDDEAGAEYGMEFRVGGREYARGKNPHGPQTYRYEAIYQDIVPAGRIISSYDMQLDAERISVSLSVVEFRADGAGTELVITEHGAFLDGLDRVELREQGTLELMEALGAAMEEIEPCAD